jgi:hypothetical protein
MPLKNEENRFKGQLLTAIENKDDVYAPNSLLQLTAEEQREILIALNGNLYGIWFCKHILLRLGEALADVDASYTKWPSVVESLPEVVSL